MVELQVAPRSVESAYTVRCPQCGGLRGVSARHAARGPILCQDCRKGQVVDRTKFHRYWTERFSIEEIRVMAKAIWE